MELKAYSVQLRKTVDILNPKLVTLKNGRKAIQGVAAEDTSAKVLRIICDKDAAEFEKKIG